MNVTRLYFSAVLLCAFALAQTALAADSQTATKVASTVDTAVTELPPAADFVADAQQAARHGVPILVLVSRDDCVYCLQLKRAVLVPMRRSGDYERKLIMRELNVDWQAQITDFSGQRRSAADWAQQHNATFTPTVLLLDPGGREVAERLVGINTVDMYGWYLDQAIAVATKKIKGESDE